MTQIRIGLSTSFVHFKAIGIHPLPSALIRRKSVFGISPDDISIQLRRRPICLAAAAIARSLTRRQRSRWQNLRPFVQVLLPSIVETSALNSLLPLARSPQRTFGSRQSVLPLSEVQHRLKVLGRLPLSVRLQLPNNSPILFALQGGEAFHYSHPPLSHPIPGGRSSSSIRTAPLCFPVS